MTVPANLNRVDYTGTGSAGPFTVPFPFYDASHLTVLQTDALFNQTTLTGWTATGAGGPSGAVTLAAACPVGSTLTIMREVPLTQVTSIKNQEAFYPEIHEKEFDLLAMADQQIDETLDRTLRLPAGLSGVDMTLPRPDPGHSLIWNLTGTALENAAVASADLQQDLSDSVDSGHGDALIAVKQPFTGSVARTQHTKNQDHVSILDFGAVGDGITNDAPAIQNALDSTAEIVFIPAGGNYRIESKITIPFGKSLIGGNKISSIILVASDIVGIEMSSYSRLADIGIKKTGSHTKNLIDIGSLTNLGGRQCLERVYVEGAGAHGIYVTSGNCGSMRDITSVLNGQDGIHFSADTEDNNAWKLEGLIDCRANGRDGLHFHAASSVNDPKAPRTHSVNYVASQQNGRYGVYVGTRSNQITAYVEANSVDDLYLDNFAAGNDIIYLECGTYSNNGESNRVSWHNGNAAYQREFFGPVLFHGGVGNGIILNNSDGTVGSLGFFKSTANTYKFSQLSGTATPLTIFDHSNGTNKHVVKATGGYITSTSSVAIPSGTPTTIATFGTANDDAFCGIIHVRDSGGTTIGSVGIITNFTAGGVQVLQLSSVSNSTYGSSALTVSGSNIQFAHAFGTTRTMTVSIISIGLGKSF